MLLIPGGLIGLALAILAGRLSDRVGRKPMAFTIVALAGISFFLFYNGVPGWAIPPLWIVAFFGFFSGDALIAGFALEIVPTHYRATVSGLRYLVEIGFGAVALALEGVLLRPVGVARPRHPVSSGSYPHHFVGHPVPARTRGPYTGGNGVLTR